jgi:hypothetical protein
VLGHDRDLDLAFLDIKNAVGDLPLGEDFLIFPYFPMVFPTSAQARNVLGLNVPFKVA